MLGKHDSCEFRVFASLKLGQTDGRILSVGLPLGELGALGAYKKAESFIFVIATELHVVHRFFDRALGQL